MDNWSVGETTFDPHFLGHKETVFTIGNGYLGSRGTFEEGYPGETAATLVHGLFDDVPVVATELVNTPNWMRLLLFIDGERFRLDQGKILDYHRSLNLRNGVLRRFVRWQSPSGKTIEVIFERFASLADPHRVAVRLLARALDFDALVEVRADLPGHTDNEGFLHWDWVDQGRQDQQSAYLRLETKASKVALGQAFHLAVQSDEPVEYQYWDSDWTPTLVARTHLQKGRQIVAEKLVVTYSGRDADDPLVEARAELQAARAGGYARLLAANEAAWAAEWEASNITIEGDDEADRALRYSLFQLLIAAPRRDERVSIAAKTLSGYGYRGHVFWDTEIFMLPFFIYTQPEIARNLLLYRYHTLPGARRKALKNGYEGAMFAWESAGSGDETTPRWVPSPEGEELIRIWCGDIEHHITADIAYAVMQYWRAAGDDDFMVNYGAELVLESARFWGSRAEWNDERGVYEITDVIGPDEYHDHVDNNAYTNLLARWNIRAGFDVLAWLQESAPVRFAELTLSLELSPARLAHWENVEAKIFRGYDSQTQLFEQFEGYFDLRYQDLENYEPRTISMQALLGIEGAQDYQYIKQPDVVMMLFLLRGEFEPEVIRANYDYYTARTDLTYGSSLGPAVQALLAARYGKLENAYRHFMHAARTDLEDARRNAADGIHGATAGGLWQAVVFGFAGLAITDGRPTVKPTLPAHWRRLSFSVMVHGQRYDFDLQADTAGEAQSGGAQLPIQAVIFDLDGVLTDTSEYHYQAWKRLADEDGLAFDREANEALRGVSRRESLLLILQGREVSEAQLQDMMDRKNTYYLEMISALTPEDLLPGARRLLEELRAAGIKTAIGSASKNARLVVKKLGIADLIAEISDGASVADQKPAPDLFLHAARSLGVEPARCLVFEDAEAGVQAALAAGMWAVGLGPQERVRAAHLVLPDLQAVDWKNLQDRLQETARTFQNA